jgi:nucleotide-binding universal stress UspA family protein
MKRFKNILFVADREEAVEAGLERAIAVARTNAARLTVMDVTPDTGLTDYFRQRCGIDLNAQLRENRLQSLDALVRLRADKCHAIYTKVVTGTPFIETILAVRRNDHDLVMKVAQNSTGLPQTLFGSTDMHLLRKCPCPVWIDRPTQTGSYRRVLAAVDPFDDESGDLQRLILDLASSLAEREQAEFEVVHAWQLPGESILRNGRGRIAQPELDRLLQEKEKRHWQELDALLSHYGLDSGSENVHLVKGEPAQVVSKCASDRNTDLIVMGTVGRAGIPGLIIGNTAESVLRETRTAVLAVKPGGFVSPVSG